MRRVSRIAAWSAIPTAARLRCFTVRAIAAGCCWTEVWQRTLYDSWDISGEIAAIEAPLLSIQGTEDAYGLPGQLESIGSAVAHARTEMIAGLGHFPQLEDPERIVGMVQGFLEPYCR